MPFKLRSRYYPILMIIFFNIFTLPVLQFDVYLAYILGLIQTRFCGGTIVCCSGNCLRAIERWLVTIFGTRDDIYLLENSTFKDYDERIKHSIFKEGNQNTIKDLDDMNQHSENESRSSEI